MNSEIEKLFRELDLEPDADLHSVRQSYRQLVKVWHPDRFDNDRKLQAVANDKLKKINFAYEKLVGLFETGKSSTPPPPQAKTATQPKATQTPAATELYRRGLERYHERDYCGALRFFQQAADRGDACAQYAAGYILYQHTKRNMFTLLEQHRNEKQAFSYWRDAAEQGNPDAQYMLGICHQYALCTPYNGDEAKRLFQRAASKGHSQAKERLRKRGVLNLSFLHGARSIPLAKWVMEPPPSAPPPS